jgi:hypothetical protein
MLVATFRLEHEALALQDAYESVSGLTVEAERVAAHMHEVDDAVPVGRPRRPGGRR